MAHPVPTWLYSAEGAQIFDLLPGAPLPEGWQDTPVATVVHAEAGAAPEPRADLEDALRSAVERIGELEKIIETGRSENKALADDLASAEEELDAAAKQISRLTTEVATLKPAAAAPAETEKPADPKAKK